MLIRFVWVGRTRFAPAREWIEDLKRRIERLCPVEIAEVKDAPGPARSRAGRESRALLDKALGRGLVIALDESGEPMTSREFARFLARSLETQSEVTFVLGGPEGLARELLSNARKKLALSRMTLTHEMARIHLIEQVYRALTLLRGIPYHR